MKKLFLFLIILSIPSIASANTFQKLTIDGITFNNVIYNVNSNEYKIHAAISDSETSIDQLAKRENAITGINGIFFCPEDYTECNWKSYTINERIVNWVDYSFYPDTWERAIFWWDKNWVPLLHQTARINPDSRGEIFEGMGNFPILFANGISQLEHYHDIGLYDNKMKNPMKRHFICSTKDKSKIIFGSTSSASLDDLTPALFKLGCWDAINLDAWNSTQYLYNGRRLEYSNRNILDGFVIERVGLNVAEQEKKISYIMSILRPLYKRYTQEKAESRIREILWAITSIRAKIYDENSVDTYTESWEYTGYVIDITSLPLLTRVYLLNRLERELKILQTEISS